MRTANAAATGGSSASHLGNGREADFRIQLVHLLFEDQWYLAFGECSMTILLNHVAF